MTLHTAIAQILARSGKPLTALQIADEINISNLYQRSDKQPITSSQVKSRVNKYPQIFEINQDNGIFLRPDLDKLTLELRNFIAHRATGSGNTYFAQLILSSLFAIRLFSNKSLYDRVMSCFYPDEFGNQINLYNHFLKDIDVNYLFNNPDRIIYIIQDMMSRTIGDAESIPVSKFKISEIKTFLEIVQKYQKDITEISDESFLLFFRKLSINLNQMNRVNMFSSPGNLTNYISELISLKPSDSVLDPFMGFGGLLSDIFLKNSSNNISVTGWEISKNVAFIGWLTAYLSGAKQFIVQVKDSFDSMNSENYAINAPEQKYDWVISVPPFHIESNSNEKFFYYEPIGRIELKYKPIFLALSLLNNNGKALLLIPNNLLFGQDTYNTKAFRYLVQNGIIENIITLPHGIFYPFSNIKTSIIILQKSPLKISENITFSKIANDSLFDFPIYENMETSQAIKEQSINNLQIPRTQILDNGFSFILNDDIKIDNLAIREREDLKPLKSVIKKYARGTKKVINNRVLYNSIPTIQIRDISNSNKGFLTFPIANISRGNLEVNIPDAVHKDAILIAMIGSKFKSAVYHSETPAFIIKSILAIYCDSKLIVPEFLNLQMHEPYFINQVDEIRKGETIPYLTNNDFLNLKIWAPSIEEQLKVINNYHTFNTNSGKTSEPNSQQSIEVFTGIIKHNMMQPLSALKHQIDSLNTYLLKKASNKSPISYSDNLLDEEILLTNPEYLNDKNYELGSVIERLGKNVNIALEHLDKASQFSFINQKPDCTLIDLRTFIHDEVMISFHGKGVNIKVGGQQVELNGDKSQLRTMFINLIDNAIKHGFKNHHKSYGKRKVIFHLSKEENENGRFAAIEYKNNGDAPSSDYTFDKFISKSVTSDKKIGTGFGGFLIYQIIKNHGGYIEQLPSNNLDEFQFGFKIMLPI